MRRGRVDVRIALAVTLLAASAGVAAWRVGAFGGPVPRPAGAGALTRDDPAPEFEGLTRWFNLPAGKTSLRLADLRGRVVLVDFWTYSCVNCVRTFPELRAFHRTYAAAGLTIVGVHAPEFDFEKDPGNVARAVREKGVEWPVAMDNDHRTWRAYRNRFWPHVYLIDARGRIRYDHVGEGGAARIEAAIRELLHEAGAALPAAASASPTLPSRGITPEIYLGYRRGEPGAFLANEGGYVKDRVERYALPPASILDLPQAGFFLAGSWRAGPEAIVAAEHGARIVLPFTARNVFVVGGDGAFDVLLDGAPLDAARGGEAVRGALVSMPAKDLYHVVRLPGVEPHQLTLLARAPGVAAYSFTFG